MDEDMGGLRDLLSPAIAGRVDSLAGILKARGANDRVDSLTLLCRDVLRSVPVVSSGGGVMYFGGRVWCPASRRDLLDSLGNILTDMGVSPTDVRRMADMPLSVLSERAFRPDPSLLAFTNGVLNLRDGTLAGFSPDLPVTESLPYTYDKDASCPMWEAFLAETLPDASVRAVLQEFVGCCYVDRSRLSIEKFAIFLGSGANGKSVIREVVSRAMGKDNVAAFDAEQITRPEMIPHLGGKRVNFASDMRATAAFDSALKALASGQEVVGRRLYGEPETVKAPPIVFSMNRLPPFRDTSDAFFRRVLLFRFDVVVPEGRRDARLADRICSSELPGVFRWIMEGRKRIIGNGGAFSPCPAMDSWLGALRSGVTDSSNPVRAWLEARGYSLSPVRQGQPSVLVSQNEIDLGLRGTVSRYMITSELRRHGVKTFRSKELFYRVYRKDE